MFKIWPPLQNLLSWSTVPSPQLRPVIQYVVYLRLEFLPLSSTTDKNGLRVFTATRSLYVMLYVLLTLRCMLVRNSEVILMAYLHIKFYMFQLNLNMYKRLNFSWTAWRWRWKHYASSKHREVPAWRQSVRFQKTGIIKLLSCKRRWVNNNHVQKYLFNIPSCYRDT